eukprot:TRINITY_DN20156_c0_g1_i1.p1 TRINITY_DN20156_c0_g1~~TRINITY_DN20156_c0_g1_i1.p1  ORF type:complete len:821 (+),score=199.81 TRINITY_DN20156_c0_g1_i1:46-2508(+)
MINANSVGSGSLHDGSALSSVSTLAMTPLVAAGAARLDAGLPMNACLEAAPQSTFDFRIELESYLTRSQRSRAEEASALRRSAEEAERLAARQREESERLAIRFQAEDSALLKGFLASWNDSMEARFERFRLLFAQRLDALERGLSEEVERSSSSAREVAAARAECTAVLRTTEERFDALRPQLLDTLQSTIMLEVSQLLEEASAKTRMSIMVDLEGCRRDLDEMGKSAMAMEERLASAHAGTAADTQARADSLESLIERMSAKLGALSEAHEEHKEDAEKRSAAYRAEAEDLLATVSSAHETAAAILDQRVEESCTTLRRQMDELRQAMQYKVEASLATAARSEQVTELESRLLLRTEAAAREASKETNEFVMQASRALEATAERRAQESATSLTELEERWRRRLKESLHEAAEERRTEFGMQAQAMKSEFRTVTSELRQRLDSLATDCGRLTSEVTGLKALGQVHEWVITRCAQRLRYLVMSGEGGLWLNSDPFNMGLLGPLTLRIYPSGVEARGGDGQCAVSLHLSAEAAAGYGSDALPATVELAAGRCKRRATCMADKDNPGAYCWVAEGLGSLESHTSPEGSDDSLSVKVEIPPLQMQNGSLSPRRTPEAPIASPSVPPVAMHDRAQYSQPFEATLASPGSTAAYPGLAGVVSPPASSLYSFSDEVASGSGAVADGAQVGLRRVLTQQDRKGVPAAGTTRSEAPVIEVQRYLAQRGPTRDGVAATSQDKPSGVHAIRPSEFHGMPFGAGGVPSSAVERPKSPTRKTNPFDDNGGSSTDLGSSSSAAYATTAGAAGVVAARRGLGSPLPLSGAQLR